VTQRTDKQTQKAVDRLAWFIVLDGARSQADRPKEAQARQALRDLGVRVTFSRSEPPKT
jgi:hypothetical protein